MHEFTIGVAETRAQKRSFDWGLLLLLGLCVATVSFTLPNFLRTPTTGRYPPYRCQSNCKNIATALTMYAEDNGGRYPLALGRLTAGNCLKLIPTCPAAGTETYSANYQTARSPERFSFVCTGNNHAKAYAGFSTSSNNYPRFNSDFGLLDHP